MSINPAEEVRRIEAKYKPAGVRDLIAMAAVAAIILLASLIWNVDWSVFMGTCIAFIAWEITKLRLRRNARDFADRSRKR